MSVAFLHRGDDLDARTSGELARSLNRIAKVGIPIVPTAVLPNTAFESYIAGRLNRVDVERALDGLKTEMPTAGLIIRVSLPSPAIWCENGLQVRRDLVETQNAVQRIFRSFTSPRSRASRIAMEGSDDIVAPIILIQPKVAILGSILSRHAVTGQPTSEHNWRENINNTIRVREREPYFDTCRRAEEALGVPSYLTFSSTSDPAIVNIERPTMTESGWLTSLLDLHRKQAISAIELLRQVQPSAFGYLTGRFKLNQSTRTARVTGIAASPGQGIGVVVVRGYTKPRRGLKLPLQMFPVLFLREAVPDDVEEISAAAAAVQSIGGKSSHLAVMSRGMAKPCVVGTMIDIDERERCLRLPNGLRVKEGSIVAIDADCGILEFGESPDLVPDKVMTRMIDETKAELIGILEAETNSPRFRGLSINDQTHLAALKFRLQELHILS